MLSEKQIRVEKRILLAKKRKVVKAQKKCKEGGKAWVKHKANIKALAAQLKLIGTILKGTPINYKLLKSKKEVASFVMKMQQIKTLVRETLTHNVKSRDDDNLLCFLIWEKQGSTPKMTYKAFQSKLIIGKFASPESIGRVRRSLQEKYLTLRGELYDKRHKAEEKFLTQYSLNLEE